MAPNLICTHGCPFALILNCAPIVVCLRQDERQERLGTPEYGTAAAVALEHGVEKPVEARCRHAVVIEKIRMLYELKQTA